MSQMPYSLYFHVPFCRHRCGYCDFNTYAGREGLIPDYIQALCRELACVARQAPERLRVQTIFFGGGTPSLLGARQYEAIFQALHDHFDLEDTAETSLEANPGTLSLAYLRDLRRLGFDRLSLGVQSAHADELRRMERIHTFEEAVQSVEWARRAGFENLNLDLIYGLPDQPLVHWQASLERALELEPKHLSLYALSIEPGTPFARRLARGLLSAPDPDLAAEMYEWAGERLEGRGYLQYEISNWALDDVHRPAGELRPPARACRHNLACWRGLPYLGFGAGAHGFANDMRVANILRLPTYLERCSAERCAASTLRFPLSPATARRQVLPLRTQMQERLMLGLRLTREGVSAADFRARFGREMLAVFPSEIRGLLGQGLLEWRSDSLRLTKKARLLGNRVFMQFVDG